MLRKSWWDMWDRAKVVTIVLLWWPVGVLGLSLEQRLHVLDTEWSANGTYKEAVQTLQEWCALYPDKTSWLLERRAHYQILDQDICAAFTSFDAALEHASCSKECAESPEEQRVFSSLLELYYTGQEGYNTLERRSAEELRAHPSFFSLYYFMAAVAAQRRDMEAFFSAFYTAYTNRPSCYLAEKIRGVVQLWAFEASVLVAERDEHRNKAIQLLCRAWEHEPQDLSLMVKIAFLLPHEEKKAFLEQSAPMVARARHALKKPECAFVLQLALEVGAKTCVQQLQEHARIWYGYSRLIADIMTHTPVPTEGMPACR